MSVQPGMPEHRGLADRIKTLEAQVARLSRARTMQSTSLDGGTFRVKNGGTIQLVNDSGDVVAELDKDSQTFFDNAGNPLTVLDGNGLEVGPASLTASGVTVGPTSLDSSGLTVGTDVEIDSDGLHVEGGDVRAIDIASGEASDTSVTLTTSFTQKAGFTVSVPSWATTAKCFCWAVVQSSDGGFGPLGVASSARIDDVDDGGGQSDTDGLTTQSFHMTEKTLSSFGSTIEFSVYARRNGGSGNPTSATAVVRGLAIFLR